MFSLDDPNQVGAPGSTLVYHGTILNPSQDDIIINIISLKFDSSIPESWYRIDLAEDFLDTLGIIPPSGYSGDVFFVQWLNSASVGVTGEGRIELIAIELIASAPANPPSLAYDFSAGTVIAPVPEPASLFQLLLGSISVTLFRWGFLRRRSIQA
jgi:hypothetical protein